MDISISSLILLTFRSEQPLFCLWLFIAMVNCQEPHENARHGWRGCDIFGHSTNKFCEFDVNDVNSNNNNDSNNNNNNIYIYTPLFWIYNLLWME
jgi:hypothetical protein